MLTRTIKIYGPADKRNILEPKLVWATPGGRGFPKPGPNGVRSVPGAPTQRGAPLQPPAPSTTQRAQKMSVAQQEALRKQQEAQQEAIRKQQEAFARAQELRQILNNLEKVDDEGRRSSLLDTLCSVEDVLELPEHPSPPGVSGGDLKVNLLKHQVRVDCVGDPGLGSVLMRSVQSQALQWCIEHEYPQLPKSVDDKPVQFWQLKQGKKVSGFCRQDKTKADQTAEWL